jgi:hypothetical protein
VRRRGTNAETILPKRLVVYIHDVGVKALDHLADNVKGAQSDAVQTLVDHWKAMSKNDKEQFVDRVATSVVAASALLPVGLKLGKKAVKKARKAIKRRAKALRKSAKRMARSSGDGKATKKKKKQTKAAP